MAFLCAPILCIPGEHGAAPLCNLRRPTAQPCLPPLGTQQLADSHVIASPLPAMKGHLPQGRAASDYMWIHPILGLIPQIPFAWNVSLTLSHGFHPAVQHRELCLVSWVRTWRKIMWETGCIYIYVFIGLGHFAVQKKLTPHCKSTVMKKIKII